MTFEVYGSEVCPIPLYDPADPTHLRIVECARSARDTMAGIAPELTGTLAKVLKRSREILKGQITEIDVLVRSILRPRPSVDSQSKPGIRKEHVGLF